MRSRISTVNLTTAGQVVAPSENVTLIVGPNNVGKSAILAGIQQELSLDQGQPTNQLSQLVSSIDVDVPQDEEYFTRLTGRARLYLPGSYPQGTYYEQTYVFSNGVGLAQTSLYSALQRRSRFGQLASQLVAFLGPEGRGGVLNSQGVPDLLNQVGRSPLQLLWADRELEATIDGYMQRAFAKRLLVNRHAGANIHLLIGQVAIEEPQIGESSPYLEEAMKLPQLSTQGSGMQAFMGTILTLATGSFDIVLLDEPEAFLHPPQARLLGEVVAEMSRAGGPQVIAATHSDDFVQGVLNASRADSTATVVRITRPTDEENRVAQVEPEAIKSLYRDPLLRYSNIINGIFYKGVVLCESESDCTYYAATLNYVEESAGLGASDLLFTQCGGKDRLDRAFAALSAASVPTAVIADIDLLADRSTFSALYEAMGGDFATIDASYNVLESSVKSKKVEPNRDEAKEAVNKVLISRSAATLTPSELKKIGAIFRAESGWKQVKKKGAGAIDSGDPTSAFASLLAACRGVGLFLVEVGELERFHSQVPSGNKQEWLRKVLEAEMFKQAPIAQEFVGKVRAFISTNQ